MQISFIGKHFFVLSLGPKHISGSYTSQLAIPTIKIILVSSFVYPGGSPEGKCCEKVEKKNQII